jgi:molybdopterin/thiamine biosynthesis adenylyltransferase/molybdopterin synthase catalytic subunit
LFRLTPEPISPPAPNHDAAGGYVTFEGCVRNHNEGKPVLRLEYEAYGDLAVSEGNKILAEAREMFGLLDAQCIHRTGMLEIGEKAVWIGVASPHRAEAFKACSYIIDELKKRVPIWKKEHYADGPYEWIGVNAPSDPGEYYRRQISLAEIGVDGQERLGKARVLVVGAGGLGAAALPYLTAAGIGTIGICEGDRVETSNLHRQVIFEASDRGEAKVMLAAQRLRRLNPNVTVIEHPGRLEPENAENLVDQYDIVVDGTDNFATKLLLNSTCHKLGKPLVAASVHRFEGHVLTVKPESAGGCLRCLWPEAPYDGCVGTCAETGVLGVVPGLFGILQANEVIHLALSWPTLAEHLLTFDLRSYESMRLRRRRREECPVCGTGEPELPIQINLERARTMRMVDIRELDEEPRPGFELERIPRARLGLTLEGPICLVCQRGARSTAAAMELRAAGVEAYSLRGGLDAL